jgi:hypothetical protein
MKRIHSERLPEISRVRTLSAALETARVSNSRTRLAQEFLIAEYEAEIKAEWLKIITPEQQSAIRRRNRRLIESSNRQSQFRTDSASVNTSSLERLLEQRDLLTALSQPEIQDQLQLTEEQFDELDALRSAAAGDAVRALRAALVLSQEHEPVPPERLDRMPVFQDLMAKTQSVLTPEQFSEFQELHRSPDRMQESMSPEEKRNPELLSRLMMPHGMVMAVSIPASSEHGCQAGELNNAFSPPAIVRALQLTQEQQDRIAELLVQATPAIHDCLTTAQAAYHNKERERARRIAAPVQEHNESFHIQAEQLLTPSQLDILDKAVLRELGIRALMKPGIRDQLQLSDEQRKSIDELFSRPMPRQPEFAGFTKGGDFQRQAAEFHKWTQDNFEASRRHLSQRDRDIAAVLSSDQRHQFSEITGHQFEDRKSD